MLHMTEHNYINKYYSRTCLKWNSQHNETVCLKPDGTDGTDGSDGTDKYR